MITNCPSCNGTSLKKVKYTWWGGIVGPAIINVTKCEECGETFNGNSGKSNTPAIVIFFIVAIGIGVLLGVLSTS